MPSLHSLVNPPSHSGRNQYPAIVRGTVTGVSSAREVWVTVPTLGQDSLQAANTVPGDLAPGDAVILGLSEGRLDNIVVLTKEAPTIPAHTHPDGDVAYPGWAAASLASGFTAGAETGAFPGLRYRTDSRFLHVHGHIGGGPGLITALPVNPVYTSRFLGVLSDGSPAPLVLGTDGSLTTESVGTIHVTASAPLT